MSLVAKAAVLRRELGLENDVCVGRGGRGGGVWGLRSVL